MYLRNSSNSVCPLQSASQCLKSFLLNQPQKSQQIKYLLNSISQLDPNLVNSQSCTQFFDIYEKLFKRTAMGLQMLKALLSVTKKLNQPITIRIIYEYSFELQPFRQNLVEIQNTLIKGFELNLSFRKKLPLGFKCGLRALKFIKDFQTFEKILQKIIVYLKAETNQSHLKQYQEKSTVNMHKTKNDKNSTLLKKKCLKNKINQLSKTKEFTIVTKAERLPFLLLLYRAYYIGNITAEIALKKDYFIELCDQLFNRLLREYPGRFIKQSIEEIQLNEKSSRYHYRPYYQSEVKKASDQIQQINGMKFRSQSFSIRNRGKSNKGPSKSITKNYCLNLHQSRMPMDRTYNNAAGSPYCPKKKYFQVKPKFMGKKDNILLENSPQSQQSHQNHSFIQSIQNSQNLCSQQTNIIQNSYEDKVQKSQLLEKSILKSTNQKSSKLNYFHNQQIQFNYSCTYPTNMTKQLNLSQQSILTSKISKNIQKDYSISNCSQSLKSKIKKINQAQRNKQNLLEIKKPNHILKNNYKLFFAKIVKDFLEDLYGIVVIKDQVEEEDQEQQSSQLSVSQQSFSQQNPKSQNNSNKQQQVSIKSQRSLINQDQKPLQIQIKQQNQNLAQLQDSSPQQFQEVKQQNQILNVKQTIAEQIMKDSSLLKYLVKIQLFFKRILATRKVLHMKQTNPLVLNTLVKLFQLQTGETKKIVLTKLAKSDYEYRIFAEQIGPKKPIKISQSLPDSDTFIRLNLNSLRINFQTLKIQKIDQNQERTARLSCQTKKSIKQLTNIEFQQFLITTSNQRQSTLKTSLKVFKNLTNQSISDIKSVRTSRMFTDEQSELYSIQQLKSTLHQNIGFQNNFSKPDNNIQQLANTNEFIEKEKSNNNSQIDKQAVNEKIQQHKTIQNDLKLQSLKEIVEQNQQQKCSLKQIIDRQTFSHKKTQSNHSSNLAKNPKSVKICSKIQQFDITDFQFSVKHEFNPHIVVMSNSISMILTDPITSEQQQINYFFIKSSVNRLRHKLQERVTKCLDEAINAAGSHKLSDITKYLKKQILQCQEVELHSVLTFGIEDTAYVIRFQHDEKNKCIIADAGNGIPKIKIILSEQQKMNQIISMLMTKQISIKGENNLSPEIVIPNIWVVIEQTSIIINDLKRQMKIKCILEEKVTENVDKQNSIDVRIKIRDAQNSLEVNNINRKLRNKIKNNLSTLIGYYLKIENGQPTLQCNSEKIQRFLQLL